MPRGFPPGRRRRREERALNIPKGEAVRGGILSAKFREGQSRRLAHCSVLSGRAENQLDVLATAGSSTSRGALVSTLPERGSPERRLPLSFADYISASRSSALTALDLEAFSSSIRLMIAPVLLAGLRKLAYSA